jgi:hypothetical protein
MKFFCEFVLSDFMGLWVIKGSDITGYFIFSFFFINFKKKKHKKFTKNFFWLLEYVGEMGFYMLYLSGTTTSSGPAMATATWAPAAKATVVAFLFVFFF